MRGCVVRKHLRDVLAPGVTERQLHVRSEAPLPGRETASWPLLPGLGGSSPSTSPSKRSHDLIDRLASRSGGIQRFRDDVLTSSVRPLGHGVRASHGRRGSARKRRKARQTAVELDDLANAL